MDVPIQVLQIIGTLVGGIVLGFLTQVGQHRIQKLQAESKREEKQADVIDHREERELKAETGLRAELMVQIKEQDRKMREQDNKIEVLTQRENDCNRHMVWMQQWLWTLHAALKALGSEIDLPRELTLEGYEQPVIQRARPLPSYVPGVTPATPDFSQPDPAAGTPPAVRPNGGGSLH